MKSEYEAIVQITYSQHHCVSIGRPSKNSFPSEIRNDMIGHIGNYKTARKCKKKVQKMQESHSLGL